MISFKFHYWTGDRDAGTVTDEFILNEQMAQARAVQELCELYKIVISKQLRTTITPDLEIGQIRYFAIPRLGIEGNNYVTDISTTLSFNGCYEEISIESYKDMEIPI
jgi:hypothetical protein